MVSSSRHRIELNEKLECKGMGAKLGVELKQSVRDILLTSFGTLGVWPKLGK